MSSTLKRNKKLDKIYDAKTNLVFKSLTEKVVIGKIVDGEYVELNEDILEECKQHGFKYDENMVEEDDDDQEEDEKEIETPKNPEVVNKTEVVKPKTDSVFNSLFTNFQKEVEQLFDCNQDVVSGLERQIVSLQKELEETKKKLKAVLCAMQDTLN